MEIDALVSSSPSKGGHGAWWQEIRLITQRSASYILMPHAVSITAYVYVYHQSTNKGRPKFQNLNVSRLVLQLSLPNPMKPGVKSRVNMELEQRWQAMFKLHLSDQYFHGGV